MNFAPFSEKQMKTLLWWHPESPFKDYDGIICDGAVRSGKTLCMSLSFVSWALMNFNGTSFAFAGKTIESVRRNVMPSLLSALYDLGFSVKEKISSNYLDISFGGKKNRFYIFGGRDEQSASLIQGVTLGGVMFDEAALLNETFLEQAVARCSVDGSKFFFNCNPETPAHSFYKEWIEKRKEKNCLYVHFTMDDNLSLSDEIKERYKNIYEGVFYERFVLGKWVNPEGLVYPFFNGKDALKEVPDCDIFYISCDYGTVNPFSLGLWGRHNDAWIRVSEFYWDSKREKSQKTDEEYYNDLSNLAKGRNVKAVVCDPSAASFMECVRRRGEFTVIPAVNDVEDGIRRTSECLKSGKIKISACCRDIIREFSLYRWKENEERDAPVKENDHAMDDMRYFVSTILREQADNLFVFAAERG